jgi:hypothetical protein
MASCYLLWVKKSILDYLFYLAGAATNQLDGNCNTQNIGKTQATSRRSFTAHALVANSFFWKLLFAQVKTYYEAPRSMLDAHK